MGIAAIFLLLTLVSLSAAHSWIACTDYLEENGEWWKPQICRGYSRMGHAYHKKNEFGKENGNHWFKPPDHQPCKFARNDGANYNGEYPMAIYYPGQKVVLAHPMKNHGADTCTNKWLPDSGSYIYRSGTNPSRDPSFTDFRKSLIANLGKSPTGEGAPITTYPKPGYQNAPKFCANTDSALGTYAFYLPSLPAGRYTFLWSWAFLNKDDIYTTCWEADIVPNKAERDRRLQGRRMAINEPAVLYGKSLAVRG